MITSRQNSRIKAAAALRLRRRREAQSRTLIDGRREIEYALRAGLDIKELFYCRDACSLPHLESLLARLSGSRCELHEVTAAVLEKIRYGERNDGVVAVASIPRRRLADLALAEGALVVVLERLEKPGNLGAVARSADATGVAAIILADGTTDAFNPNAIRASQGTLFSVPVAEATAEETILWLAQHEMSIYAATPHATIDYWDADFRGPTAIVLGGEAEGLTRPWHERPSIGIRIPMQGIADSLNVAASAAVVLYEAVRQRGRSVGL